MGLWFPDSWIACTWCWELCLHKCSSIVPLTFLSIQRIVGQSDEMHASCFSGWSSESLGGMHSICSWSLGKFLVVVAHPASKWYTENLAHINTFMCCHSLMSGNCHLSSMQKHIPGAVREVICSRSQRKQKRLGNWDDSWLLQHSLFLLANDHK